MLTVIVLLAAGCDGYCPVGRSTDASVDSGPDRGAPDLVPPHDATHAGWAISVGGAGTDGIWKIAVDPWGDLVVSGFFSGVVSFGTTTLTTSTGCGPIGGCGSFVAKLDRTGKWLWAVRLDGIPPGTRLDWDGMAVDGSGNVYYAGDFQGSATFGSTTLVSKGAEDLFVVKLDPGGKVLWAISAGGAGSDLADTIAAGTDGTLTLGGHFAGTVSFGATSLTARGHSDIVMARLDAASGGFIWAVPAGGEASDVDDAPGAVILDSAGNAYITGEMGPNASFGSHTLAGKAGQWKAFVTKLDASGKFLWAWESPAASFGAGIGRDAAGNIYIASTIALEGSPPMPGLGLAEVTKLDPTGQELRSKVMASEDTTQGTAILVDDEGRVALSGVFRGTVYLGPTKLVSSENGLTGYLARLDAACNVLGGEKLSPTGWATAISLARGPGGDVYLGGQFGGGTATLGGTSLPSNGASDGFVWNRGPDQE